MSEMILTLPHGTYDSKVKMGEEEGRKEGGELVV